MPDSNTLIDQIDALLPQTQCGQCGFDGCRPYAEAIVEGRADINQCPPGGNASVTAIAALLNVPTKSLNPAYGQPKPPMVALIDEAQCIGCTFCIRACPVDAIVGAAKHMHTILTELCTGCERCLAPCPMDCISMVPLPAPVTPEQQQQKANDARARYHRRQRRLASAKQTKLAQKKKQSTPKVGILATDTKQAAIQAAMERARAKLARSGIPVKPE